MQNALIAALRVRGVDVLTAHEAGTRHWKDADQLRFATGAGRVLFTKNVGDFTRLHREIMAAGGHHAGIIVLNYQRYGVGEQLRRLIALLTARTAVEMADSLEYLSNWG